MQNLPAIRLEAFTGIICKSEISRSINRYVVVVVEADQLPEPKVAGERGGFVRDPLHHVAVAADEVRVVIDDVVARSVEDRRQVRLGERHPHCVRYALAQWPGGRFNSWCVTILRV